MVRVGQSIAGSADFTGSVHRLERECIGPYIRWEIFNSDHNFPCFINHRPVGIIEIEIKRGDSIGDRENIGLDSKGIM